MNRRGVLAALTAAALGVAACDDDVAPEATLAAGSVSPVTTSTVAPQSDDGVLTIGLMLPSTGDGAAMGQFLSDAARQAISAVNGAGGVQGQVVEVLAVDEGDTSDDAVSAARELIEAGVDAVVGPASSTATLASLQLLLDNNIVTCSPTATALSLDDFPDRELFLRTAPSDSLQAVGLADLAERSGRTTVAVGWIDDVYGRPFASAVIASLEARSTITLAGRVSFTEADVPRVVARELVQAGAGALVIIADAENGAALLAALDATIAGDASVDQPDVIINDAMRRPPSPQTIATLSPGFRSRVRGLAPAAAGGDLPGPFAANAFDCATLLALAAEVAGPDDHLGMAAAINELSSRGGGCRDFVNCRDQLAAGRNVDYDGPVGPVQIGTDGDPERALFDNFSFTDEGIDRTDSQTVVGR